MQNTLPGLSAAEFAQLQEQQQAVIIDTRPSDSFVNGFIPNAISLGQNGRFAEWAVQLIPITQPVLLVTNEGEEAEAMQQLTRAGYSHLLGYLQGGIPGWQAAGFAIDMIIAVEPDELAMDLPYDDNLMVVDVRTATEYGQGHVTGAHNLPLEDMTDMANLAMLPPEANLYLHCANGYRSVIAASLLKRQGIHNLRHVQGGYAAIALQEGIPTEQEKQALN
ncbi:MAG TPA: rhodanese-like domain-containing protein [Phnomibacter sp.]|nr:rhodanese-like domain-containing protein [Phnomibacter sp.]